MEDWKNDRAEGEMRQHEAKMMEESRKKFASEKKVVGNWKITVKGNSNSTKEDLEKVVDELIEFTKKLNVVSPNIEASIDPVIEEEK
ncbi:MAG: hypothetical protein AABY15_02185 [Nanoarchaeota archaeon]